MLLTSCFRDRPAFGFQHGAQLLDPPVEGTRSLWTSVRKTWPLCSTRSLERSRTLAADDLAVGLRHAPERAVAVTALA